MNTSPSTRFFGKALISLFLLLLFSGVPAGVAHAQSTKVAVLGLENLNRDPRYDYLEGMIIGVLMYDLIRVDDIDLVERAKLDRILEEQQLRLTGLLNDTDTAKQVGQLAGADALVEGDYAFLGREMIINLRILNTDDGTTIPLSVRGYTENTVHNLAEQLVEELTGTPVIFAGIDGERSLLSLSDEEPGSIEFYCNFQQGEILVDEEFYGYTPGGTVPTLLEDLSPGEHTIRVEAGNNFGEIEWPQVVFKDWERTVTVKAGRKIVVRAEIHHFNDLLYNAMRLYSKNWHLERGVTDSIDVQKDLSFQDRSGRMVPVYFSLSASVEEERPVVLVRLEADGENREWNIQGKEDEIEMEEQVGIIEVDVERNWYSNRYWSIDVSVWRRDIHQNLHHEEG